jgi:hypothetical protein
MNDGLAHPALRLSFSVSPQHVQFDEPLVEGKDRIALSSVVGQKTFPKAPKHNELALERRPETPLWRANAPSKLSGRSTTLKLGTTHFSLPPELRVIEPGVDTIPRQ